MTHTLATLAMNAPADNQVAKSDTATQMTRIALAGNTLFSAIDTSAQAQSTTINAIRKVALEDGLTVAEFDDACKVAQQHADMADKTAGFEVASDAKGAEKYGPKRRVLNQRLSEAKQLFGVFKMEPMLLEGKGYWPALEEARDFLKSQGIKWNGEDNTKEGAEEKKAAKMAKAAMIEAAEATAHIPGESEEAYTQRLVANKRAIEEESRQAAFEAAVTKLVDKMLDNNEPLFNQAVALNLLAQCDKVELQEHIARLSEIARSL